MPKPQSASQSEYPRKLFYRIQEVSEITGLKPYVLRYWESEFTELAPEKDANDQRRYRQKDIEIVLRIKDLLYEQKFTIAGARKRLREEKRGVARRRSGATRREALRGIRAELCDLMNQLSA